MSACPVKVKQRTSSFIGASDWRWPCSQSHTHTYRQPQPQILPHLHKTTHIIFFTNIHTCILTKPTLTVGLPGFNIPGLWKSFQDIERSKQWGEMALGFPWQLLQAAKRAALKTYVRLDWFVHSEPSNRFCVQPITLSCRAFTGLTFDFAVRGLRWLSQKKTTPIRRGRDCLRKNIMLSFFLSQFVLLKVFTAAKEKERKGNGASNPKIHNS